MLVPITYLTALILDFQKKRSSAILDFTIFVKNSNLRLFLRRSTKFGEIRTVMAELLHIFDLQNGGSPPSWIWYDVVADHPRLVFDGRKIFLKFHVARYRDFYIWPVWLEIAYSRPLGEFLEDITPNEFRYCRNPQKDRLWAETHRISHKPWEGREAPLNGLKWKFAPV